MTAPDSPGSPTAASSTDRPVRLGVLGSGAGSNYGALANAVADGRLHAEFVIAISDVESAGLLTKARDRGVPAVYVDPGPFLNKLSDEAQEEMARLLLDAGAEYVVCAGFMRKLKAPVLDAFPRRILNIHPSLLPAYPGRDAIAQVLAAGIAETGCTVHLVNEEIDAGDILAQTPVPVLPDDTHATLTGRVNAAEHILYPQAISDYVKSGPLEPSSTPSPDRRPNPVVTTATLLRRTGERTFDAVLPNGHPFIAHVPSRKAEQAASLQEGQEVTVELTTYDFSTGRIALP